jgi:branched-chain amino acid transport system substrate-binding protein
MKKQTIVIIVVIVALVIIGIVLALGITQPVTAQPIKVGALMEYTGAWSGWGPYQDDEMAVCENVINSDPPLGRKIVWVKYDMRSTAEGGLDAVKKMVTIDGVNLIIYLDSVTGPAIRPWLQETGRLSEIFIITCFGGGLPDNWGGTKESPWFRVMIPDTAQAWAQAHWVAQKGFTKAVVMGSITEEVAVWIEAIQKALPAKGVNVLDVVKFEPGQTSYRDVLARAMASNPQVVLLGAMDEDAGIIWKQAYEMGFTPTWVAINDAATARSIELAGGADLSKTYATAPAGIGAGYDEFLRQWKRVLPDRGPYALSAGAWDSMIALALAIEKAGNTKAASLVDAIREVCLPPGEKVTSYQEAVKLIRKGVDIDFEGAASNLNFDANGNVWGDFWVLSAKGTTWEQIATITNYR